MNRPHLLLLALWALAISAQVVMVQVEPYLSEERSLTAAQELVPTTAVEDLQGDLQIQEWMRELRRVKRAPTRNVQPVVVVLPGFDATRASTYYQDVLYPGPLRRRRAKRARYCPILGGPGSRCKTKGKQKASDEVASDSDDDSARYGSRGAVVLSANGTGRCVVSADQASHFCGMEEEGKPNRRAQIPVESAPCARGATTDVLFAVLVVVHTFVGAANPTTTRGQESGRKICYPHYEDLDTSCTDVTGRTTSGLVAPPVIPHATVRAMAFVPPDNLRRLVIQYYRQQGKLMPKNMTFTPK
ncbi:unnamed protein product [Strongylus vulgaris]|uniref:Uncharacterized protein n=1 Tax=Strongylus vulgaris TaxID=40348 RepID=A0A3P7IC05_STRVU|nr:unnamed protein product [Strongylus vulgaris]